MKRVNNCQHRHFSKRDRRKWEINDFLITINQYKTNTICNEHTQTECTGTKHMCTNTKSYPMWGPSTGPIGCSSVKKNNKTDLLYTKCGGAFQLIKFACNTCNLLWLNYKLYRLCEIGICLAYIRYNYVSCTVAVCVLCSSKTFTWLTHISHVVAIFYAIDSVTWNSIAIFESSFSISNICLLSFRLHTCITRRNLFVWSVLWSSNKQEHFHVTQNWFFCSGTLKWPKRSSVVKTTKHKSDLTKTLLWPPRFIQQTAFRGIFTIFRECCSFEVCDRGSVRCVRHWLYGIQFMRIINRTNLLWFEIYGGSTSSIWLIRTFLSTSAGFSIQWNFYEIH